MSSIAKFLIFFLSISRAAFAQPESASMPGPENYTHVAAISLLDTNAVVASAGLPQWAYLASLHDLADLQVFNAEGLAVGFRLVPLLSEGKTREFPVNAVPVPDGGDKAGPSSRTADVKVDLDGKVDVHLGEPIQGDATAPSKITQWIVDDPNVSAASINHFRFNIADAGKSDYSADIDIEASEDLRTWQPIALRQKILVYGKQRLAQLGISFTPTKARYWRIKSADQDLTRMAQILTGAPAKAEPVSANLDVQCQISPNREKLLCPLGGRFPINELRFDFGKQHVAFNAKIEGFDSLPKLEGDDKNLKPKMTASALLTNADSDAVTINTAPLAAITVSAEQGGKLALAKPPMLNVAWPAQELQFMVNGNPPFTLAVGMEKLIAGDNASFEIRGETTGAIIASPVIQTAKAFTPKAPEQKKPWLLWGLLGAAVLSLGGMAVSLLRKK
jgi:Protein of unknown function (DUF3999)